MLQPTHEHPKFDALCAEVDEFETLPTVTVAPAPQTNGHEPDLDEHTAPIDEQILAGLVSI